MAKEIHVDYLARVEGETSITVSFDGNEVEELKLKIFEPPRFFEGFLVGRSYEEVGDIVSRICGICPVSHMTTAILALEKACGISVSEQTRVLREVLCLSQIAASHVIHLYMLALPDYFGKENIFQMVDKHRAEVDRLIRLKEVLNGLTALIGGRGLHPVTHMPGGFTRLPDQVEWERYIEKLDSIRPDVEKMVRFISSLNYPDFSKPAEYVCVDGSPGYSIAGERIISSYGLDIGVDEYADFFVEEQVSYAMAKKSTIRGRGSFMSGALARLNVKFSRLNQATRDLAEDIGLKTPDFNPFHNNIAQALEAHHAVEECIRLMKGLRLVQERRSRRFAAGEGAAATEAPRGLLYHWYRVNRRGVIEKANIVTPTSHNFANIENDLRSFVASFADLPLDELRMGCEKLVRAYDPCYSCSVH